MNQYLGTLTWGTLFVASGTFILLNLESMVRFDQSLGVRLKSWFNKKLGESFLNRELWSVGTPSGFRGSRIAFRIVGVFCVVFGVVLLVLAFRGYLR